MEPPRQTKAKRKSSYKTFFPPPPPADLSDIIHADYTTNSVPCDINITKQQLRRVIRKLSPNKAPGPDGIINKVLKDNIETLEPHLMTLIQASLDTGHFPKPLKKTITVVLRKPLKPDYTKPNAYQPIALENTIGKVIESIITELISYLIKTRGLLPANHFGGRPQRTTTDAMTVLTENIHRAWKGGDVYSVVFMDVGGAFNNVHHDRLLHNMRKRRIPVTIINIIAGRTTQLYFNSTITATINTPTGIP